MEAPEEAQASEKAIFFVRRQQDGWDSIATDSWIQPNGDKIGEPFNQV